MSTPSPSDRPVLVNLGCGAVWDPDWINLDFVPQGKSVQRADLRGRLRIADSSADAIYSSHFLEHLDREDAPGFLAETQRILKPGGILRIVVPDLVDICRNYLQAFEAVENGNAGERLLYEWSRLELLDQMARRYSGGGDASLPRRSGNC